MVLMKIYFSPIPYFQFGTNFSPLTCRISHLIGKPFEYLLSSVLFIEGDKIEGCQWVFRIVVINGASTCRLAEDEINYTFQVAYILHSTLLVTGWRQTQIFTPEFIQIKITSRFIYVSNEKCTKWNVHL